MAVPQPSQPQDTRRRPELIGVRLTTAELRELRVAAAQHDVTPAAYIRQVLAASLRPA